MSKIRAYDPRDAWQKPEDPSTWLLTENPALIRASKAKGEKSPEYWRGIAMLAEMHDEENGAKP